MRVWRCAYPMCSTVDRLPEALRVSSALANAIAGGSLAQGLLDGSANRPLASGQGATLAYSCETSSSAHGQWRLVSSATGYCGLVEIAAPARGCS